jgi:hypothetical protein
MSTPTMNRSSLDKNELLLSGGRGTPEGIAPGTVGASALASGTPQQLLFKSRMEGREVSTMGASRTVPISFVADK